MAKMQGLAGKLSGKMGSVVFRVREGEQIVTQYNPIVKNPNTTAQSTQRAAFKLMSQVAATMASAIINRPARQGQSSRNRFVQQNFPLVEGNASEAKIAMDRLQLTSSSTYLGLIEFDGNTVEVTPASDSVTKVRFVQVNYLTRGGQQTPVVSRIVDVDVQEGSASLTVSAGSTVLAYGLIPTSSAAKLALDNLSVVSGSPFIAQVKLERMISSGDLAVTETIGVNTSTGS